MAVPFDIDPLHVFYLFAAGAVVLVAEAFYLLVAERADYRSRVNRRLSARSADANGENVLLQLRRERGLTAEGRFRLSIAWLNRLIVQSGVTVGLWPLLGGAFGSAVIAGAAVYFASVNAIYAAVATFVGGIVVVPATLAFLRARRIKAFAVQFPDAIDIIVRSLRAGHPVPVAIALVAREMADPIGSEFGMVSDEITYGTDLETAMRNLMLRVGQEDLPLFVTSIAIQSSTGGNLSQILDNLSGIIRERFQVRRKIRALSSEGRSGAMILGVTPFATFMIINFMSPDFYGAVWGDPRLTYGLMGAGMWMFIGVMIMKKMINFRF
ncbi:MAG: type II secretion system F family protein [Hyphomicrobiales bacterium]|nr:type II secretion system F family protein [Hyphomicrobiales bacterium]